MHLTGPSWPALKLVQARRQLVHTIPRKVDKQVGGLHLGDQGGNIGVGDGGNAVDLKGNDAAVIG